MTTLSEHSVAVAAPWLARMGRAVSGEAGRLYLAQLLLAAGIGFGWTLQFLFLVREAGLAPVQLALYHAHMFGMGAVMMLLVPRIPARRSMVAGLLLRASLFPLLLLVTSPVHLHVVATLFGVALFLFWTPFYIGYFSRMPQDHMALSVGLLFVIWPILNALLPGAAGATVARAGSFAPILLGGMALVLGAAFVASRLPPGKRVEVRAGIRGLRRERVAPLLLLEGALQGALWAAVPLYLLFFIQSPSEYGALLSLFAVSGAAASILVAWASDRLHRRKGLLLGSTLLLALAVLSAGLSADLAQWIVLMGLVNFATNLSVPFTTTAALENIAGVQRAALVREFLHNAGRALGSLLVVLSLLLTATILPALAAAGLLFLLYPLLAYRRRLYRAPGLGAPVVPPAG